MKNINSSELEADHTLLNLFHYLAKKEAGSSRTGAHVQIPPTVVYQHGSLRAWFQYDKEGEKEIIRRDKKSCTKEEITRCFTRNLTSSPCVATFMYRKCEFMEEVTENEATSVEFLSAEGLQAFLHKRERRPDGILQKFILPKSSSNSVVQVVWSPHLILLNHRKNIHSLSDARFSLYDRCVTHEGKSHLSTEVNCSPKMHQRFNTACKSIAKHFYLNERKVLARTVLYFKVDVKGQIILMWPASVILAKSSGPLAHSLPPPPATEKNIAKPPLGGPTSADEKFKSDNPTIPIPNGVTKRLLLNLSPSFSSPVNILRVQQQLGIEPSSDEYCVVPEQNTVDFFRGKKSVGMSSYDEIAAAAAMAVAAAANIPPSPIQHNAQRWAKLKTQLEPSAPVKGSLIEVTADEYIEALQAQQDAQSTPTISINPSVNDYGKTSLPPRRRRRCPGSAGSTCSNTSSTSDRRVVYTSATNNSAAGRIHSALICGGAPSTKPSPMLHRCNQAGSKYTHHLHKPKGNEQQRVSDRQPGTHSVFDSVLTKLTNRQGNGNVSTPASSYLQTPTPISPHTNALQQDFDTNINIDHSPTANSETYNLRTLKRQTQKSLLVPSYAITPQDLENFRYCRGGGGGLYKAPHSGSATVMSSATRKSDTDDEHRTPKVQFEVVPAHDDSSDELFSLFGSSTDDSDSDNSTPSSQTTTDHTESAKTDSRPASSASSNLRHKPTITNKPKHNKSFRSALKGSTMVDDAMFVGVSDKTTATAISATPALSGLVNKQSVLTAGALKQRAQQMQTGSIQVPQISPEEMSPWERRRSMVIGAKSMVQSTRSKKMNRLSNVFGNIKMVEEKRHDSIWELIKDPELQMRNEAANQQHSKTQEWLSDLLYELYSHYTYSTLPYKLLVPKNIKTWIGEQLSEVFKKFGVIMISDPNDPNWEYEADFKICATLRKFFENFQRFLCYHYTKESIGLLEDIGKDLQTIILVRGIPLNILDVDVLEKNNGKSSRLLRKAMMLVDEMLQTQRKEFTKIEANNLGGLDYEDFRKHTLGEHFPMPPGPLQNLWASLCY